MCVRAVIVNNCNPLEKDRIYVINLMVLIYNGLKRNLTGGVRIFDGYIQPFCISFFLSENLPYLAWKHDYQTLNLITMKKAFLIIPILFIWALLGCENEGIDSNADDIKTLQDSIDMILEQHQALMDSVASLTEEMEDEGFDIKAFKMEQAGSVFESIARQPEAAEVLISATALLYNDYTELLPISDEAVMERGRARGIAFSTMFESIGRQPEAYDMLDSAAARFLGAYDPSFISDEMLEVTKAYSVAALNESIGRQPAADSLFNLATQKYLNESIHVIFK